MARLSLGQEPDVLDAIQADDESTPEQIAADKKLIESARKHFAETSTFWHDIRQEALQDQKFYLGEQYDEAYSRAARARGNAPLIQVNQLPTKVAQVENGLRQQDIGLVVHATDEEGSEEKAEVLTGMMRHIEHLSNAKQAYVWAAGSHGALVPGFGFIKLNTRYCSPTTFNQDVVIEGVKDPFKILPDFMAVNPDFSDARFWYEFESMTKEDYKEKYTDSKLNEPAFGDWNALGTNIGTHWLTENQCTVAKYWYKETEVRHFAVFEDGTQGYLDDFGVEPDEKGEMHVIDEGKFELHPRVPEATDGPNNEFPDTEALIPAQRLAEVVKMRESLIESCHWIITNGVEILDRGEWHDSEFPFVAVIGTDIVCDGKRKIFGIIRHAKDPQKIYNYLTSQIVRKIDASNKSAWIAPLESIPEPQRKKWETSNREEHAVLYYKATDGDKMLPPPQRGDAVEPAIQALMEGQQKFDADINKTVGIFEAGIGQTMGDRQSGVAIQTLAQRGEQSNYHFSDNLTMSMKRLGTLILRLIPKVYDTARAVRIINPDSSVELVKINQMFTEGGEQKNYDLTSCENYDVVVDTGPAFATRKAEQSESLIKFAAVYPQIMPAIADIIAKNMDWDVSGAIAERVIAVQGQTMPFLHPPSEMGDVPPAARAMIGQLQGQLGQANQHVQTLAKGVQQLQQEKQSQILGHQSKERIAQLKAITDLQLKKMDVSAELAKAHDQMTIEQTKARIDHIQHMQSTHLQAMQMQDKAAGEQLPELYKQIMQMIGGDGAPPSGMNQQPQPQGGGNQPLLQSMAVTTPTPAPGNVPQQPGDHVQDSNGDMYQYAGGDKKSKASYRKV